MYEGFKIKIFLCYLWPINRTFNDQDYVVLGIVKLSLLLSFANSADDDDDMMMLMTVTIIACCSAAVTESLSHRTTELKLTAIKSAVCKIMS